MTKKSEKENDRIQIRAFWISERHSPYAYNFFKKNDLAHRGDQLSLIRSALTTGLVLNNLFPELSSFINGLNERLTAADLNRFFNGELKQRDISNERLQAQLSNIIDSKFDELLSKLISSDNYIASLALQHKDVASDSVGLETEKIQRSEIKATELEGNAGAAPAPAETFSSVEIAKPNDLDLSPGHGSVVANDIVSDNLVLSENTQRPSVSRKPRKRANANLANLAK